MARWAFGWLVLILVLTGGSYWGTSALVAADRAALADDSDEDVYAMQPLGELGSPACRAAGRALVAAGDGTRPDATPALRANWDRAARAVLQSCGQAAA